MFRITRRKLNIAFWGFFAISGAVLIAGLLSGIIIADVLLSLIVISVGIQGLLQEVSAMESRRAFRKIDESLFQLSEWAEKTYVFAKAIKEKHELRLHHLDARRSQAEQRLDKKSQEMAKRMVDLENQINSLKKAISPEPLTDSERRYSRAMSIIRTEGLISSLEYSRKLSVSRAIAAKDLARLSGMGVIRKKGKGRSVFYTSAA